MSHLLKTTALLALLLFTWDHSCLAVTYYVSTQEASSFKGTKLNPIPLSRLAAVLKKRGGGDTYIFMPGEYLGRQITLYPENSGTSLSPTILKSEFKYQAKLHGSINHNIYVSKNCNWVVLDGFATSGAGLTGIKTSGDHTAIKNCWIHNNTLQGIEAHNGTGTIIAYNLIEFNGKHIQFDHGVYASGTNLLFRGNIIRYNASRGLHLYPETSHSRIESNLIYGNNRSAILVWSPKSGGYNSIVNNTLVDNGDAFSFKNPKNNIVANNIIVNNDKLSDSVSNNITFSEHQGKLSDMMITKNLIYPVYAPLKDQSTSTKPIFHNNLNRLLFIKNHESLPTADKKHFVAINFYGKKNTENTIPYLGCFPYFSEKHLISLSKKLYYQWPFAAYNDPLNKTTKIPPDLWSPQE